MVVAHSLEGYLDGSKTQLADLPTQDKSKMSTPEEVSAKEAYQKELHDWNQKQAVILQQIVSTIPDSLCLKIKGKMTVKKAWELLKEDFKKQSRMFTTDLRQRLQEQRCEENGDVHTHFDTMCTMHKELDFLGDSIPTADFTAMLLSSLPKSYDTYLSTVTATITVLKQDLDSNAPMLSVIDEYD